MVKFICLTLFPEMFSSFVSTSIIQRAIEEKKISVSLVNIRDYSLNKHKKVDFPPCGGGSGMVMSVEPIARAIDDILEKEASSKQYSIIYLSPRGKVWNQTMAKEFAQDSQDKIYLFICGHYEGIDERILNLYPVKEVSIGDYVLTGGELPAMALIDSIARLVPGVISEDSLKEESHTSYLLEYPQYTKPTTFRHASVPDVLLGGDHQKVQQYRHEQSLEITKKNRPDLLEIKQKEGK